MPTTIAVKKAKEMMAASTLSLILSPIRYLLCRKEPALRRRVCGAKSGSLRALRWEAKQNSTHIAIYLAALPRVSLMPHRRC
jgi:hypothetical protein